MKLCCVAEMCCRTFRLSATTSVSLGHYNKLLWSLRGKRLLHFIQVFPVVCTCSALAVANIRLMLTKAGVKIISSVWFQGALFWYEVFALVYVNMSPVETSRWMNGVKCRTVSMKSKISNGSLFLDHHSRTGEMVL